MRKIYFAAFEGISLVSKIIKWWTRSSYSHIAYIYNINTLALIEAWKFYDGFRWGFSRIYHYHKSGTIVKILELKVDTYQYKNVNKFLYNLAINKVKYDFKGLFGFIFKCKDNKDKYFCSEGCAQALINSNIWPSKIKAYKIHPGYFVDLLLVSGAKIKDIIVI